LNLDKGHRERDKRPELSRAPQNLLAVPPPTGQKGFGLQSELESGTAGNVRRGGDCITSGSLRR
jgi:hypothetical protein